MRVFAPLLLLVGCLDTGPSEAPAPAVPAKRLMKPPLPPLEVEAPKPPEPADVAFVDGFELRPPIRDARLSLLPILTVEPLVGSTSYVTLAAGLASGQVTASDTGEIERIVISNRSRKPLMILGGELLVEGKQDRLIRHDLVIAPGSTQSVSTVCAEPGRMSGGVRFRGTGMLAEPHLRKLARAGDQLEVWERIQALSGDQADRHYRHAARAQHAGVHGERLDRMLAELDTIDAREERSRIVGFAVAMDDHVIAIERFASPALYRDVRSMVIGSYLPGSIGKATARERKLDAADVRAFARTNGGGPLPRQSPAATARTAPHAHP